MRERERERERPFRCRQWRELHERGHRVQSRVGAKDSKPFLCFLCFWKQKKMALDSISLSLYLCIIQCMYLRSTLLTRLYFIYVYIYIYIYIGENVGLAFMCFILRETDADVRRCDFSGQSGSMFRSITLDSLCTCLACATIRKWRSNLGVNK